MDDFFVLKFIVMKKDANIKIIRNSEIINISKLRDLKYEETRLIKIKLSEIIEIKKPT